MFMDLPERLSSDLKWNDVTPACGVIFGRGPRLTDPRQLGGPTQGFHLEVNPISSVNWVID